MKSAILGGGRNNNIRRIIDIIEYKIFLLAMLIFLGDLHIAIFPLENLSTIFFIPRHVFAEHEKRLQMFII